MFKKRYISVYENFKTGITYKILLIIGIFLALIYGFIKLSASFAGNSDNGFLFQMKMLSESTISESIIALSVIFVGVGIILFFFHCQLVKLAKIADEIENECEEDISYE